MLVQALYNVVDSIFVARISENALTAVTLVFPIQNLMISVASGTGVGVNALLSKALGEKKFDRSDKAAGMGLLLTFFSSLVFFLVGLLGSHAFLMTQTDVPEIIKAGEQYMGICCCICIGVFFQVIFERLLQSTGRTFFSMISQGTGAIVNIIFDPIMIFGLLGFPRMGVAGAAYATVLGQCTASILGLVMNLKWNSDIHFAWKNILKPDWSIIRQIYFVGVPSILMMSIGSVMTYLMNKILIAFSTTATAVFGVYFRLQSFFFMPVFGLNNGLIPVLAYNYGAKEKTRIKEALQFSIFMALGIMLMGTLAFHVFPNQLLSFFNASDEMLRIGKPALRIISLCFPIAAICIILGSIFQAFSQSVYSLIISIMRQLVVLIPVAWLLAKTGNVTFVWWAFPAAEIVSCFFSVLFFKKVYQNITLEIG
ncbi:MAG: MATE family efflux transporter [Lachnospiraceae bacterium]|nr:MATE family efflux transporter [Lachnospiraceae bacterium]